MARHDFIHLDVILRTAAESASSPELESVGVDFLSGVGVGAGVDKIWPTRTIARSCRLSPVNIGL